MVRSRRSFMGLPEVFLTPLATQCPTCGATAHVAYHTHRTITTLSGGYRLHLAVRRCQTRACPRYHQPSRPEMEGSWALPHGEFGLDVIALIGALRFLDHRSVPEIHQALLAQGMRIAERTVLNLLQRYEELVAVHLADAERLTHLLEQQGSVILAIDGLQPDVGHEVLWVIRDCLSSEILLARPLLSRIEGDIVMLLREVQNQLTVPVRAILSDGQETIREAVAFVFPGIPITPEETVVGFGSSSTDDSQSWFEILRRVFALCRSQDEIRFVNAGLTNESTTHLIARFNEVIKMQPDWIICHISSNDARRHGLSPTKTLVSPLETESNLHMLRHYADSQTTAKWVWMTPTALIEERIAANPLLVSSQVQFRNEDVACIAEILLRQPDPTVDLWTLFGHPADPALVLWDGIHPSIEGHMRIVDALLTRLDQAFS